MSVKRVLPKRDRLQFWGKCRAWGFWFGRTRLGKKGDRKYLRRGKGFSVEEGGATAKSYLPNAFFNASATFGGTKCETSPPNFATCFTSVELV